MPGTISEEQRRQVEAALVERAKRFDPAQLRRVARRGFETVEPHQRVVDGHENELVKSEEEADREGCAFTLSDNADGTYTGRFTTGASRGFETSLRSLLNTGLPTTEPVTGAGANRTGDDVSGAAVASSRGQI